MKEISRWQSCRLEDRKTDLPRTSGIYAVLNGDRIMYIGRSTNLQRRWSSGHHRYEQAARLKNPRLAWTVVEKRALNSLENTFIHQYRPAWNGTKVQQTPARFASLKPKLVALALALAAGTCIGLISLRLIPTMSPKPQQPQRPSQNSL
ncbi:MAG: hypothetical protein AAFO84_09915 [Cyanobacteria bacterium J06598_1]